MIKMMDKMNQKIFKKIIKNHFKERLLNFKCLKIMKLTLFKRSNKGMINKLVIDKIEKEQKSEK